jgi:hypothetical protein
LEWGATSLCISLPNVWNTPEQSKTNSVAIIGLRCSTEPYVLPAAGSGGPPELVDWIFAISRTADPQRWEKPVGYVGNTNNTGWTLKTLVKQLVDEIV